MYYWTMSFVIILSFLIYLFIYYVIADINKVGFGHWELATGH